ncbi:MAG: DUF2207 domain-containing protein [Elusimicrobiales bacterium]|nr:DUF2207 domain-containing protein [Elusimicrobiales bacterium]
MQNLIKKLIFSFFLLFFAVPSFAENFFIEDYKVNIEADEYKNANITEEITVYFTSPAHGIIREIPHPQAGISKIYVSDGYGIEVTDMGGTAEIKIGNKNKEITGQHKYTISYQYSYFDSRPEFYHNIIGTEWGVPIKNSSFRIKMPKEFDGSRAGLSIGRKGKAGFEGGAAFRVIDNIIVEGYMERELEPSEGITFRTEVPAGYFKKPYPYIKPLAQILLIILAGYAFFLWKKYGEDDHVVPVVSFEVPEGLNAMTAELCYKGKATAKSLPALLVEMADKGLVKINNEKKRFTLEKLSEEGAGPLEKQYLNALFGNGKTVSSETLRVSHTYYLNCEAVIKTANKERTKIYDVKSIQGAIPRQMIAAITAIILLTLFALCDFHIRAVFSCGMLSMLPLAFLLLAPVFCDEWNEFPKMWLSANSGFLLVVFLIFEIYSKESLNTACLGLACLAAALLFAHLLPKRSKEGNRLLGELLGLKKFIKTAEQPELEAMADKYPEHFYKIMPYALVLGVSGVWIKKLAKYMEAHPECRRSYYETAYLHRFSRSVSSLSRPSRANGGIKSSSGGGGRVGGGGGGGGGRSW